MQDKSLNSNSLLMLLLSQPRAQSRPWSTVTAAHLTERTTRKRRTKPMSSVLTSNSNLANRILQIPRCQQVLQKCQMETPIRVPVQQQPDTWLYHRTYSNKLRTRWAPPRAMHLAQPRLRRLYHISWLSKRETWVMKLLTLSVKVQQIKNSYTECEPQLTRLLETLIIFPAIRLCKASNLVKLLKHSH